MKPFLIVVLIMFTGCASKAHAFNELLIGTQADKVRVLLPHYTDDKQSYSDVSDCYYLQPKNDKAGPYIMIINDMVVRFDVVDKTPKILTEEGVGIGSTKQEVLKAYPQALLSPHPYLGQAGEYIEVTLPSGKGLIFETEFDVVAQYRLGRYPEIQYIEGCS
tara:strand:+ start:197138 stop:197623 length:486 start_codon:yes stop_codon:yes gene_type:complete